MESLVNDCVWGSVPPFWVLVGCAGWAWLRCCCSHLALRAAARRHLHRVGRALPPEPQHHHNHHHPLTAPWLVARPQEELRAKLAAALAAKQQQDEENRRLAAERRRVEQEAKAREAEAAKVRCLALPCIWHVFGAKLATCQQQE